MQQVAQYVGSLETLLERDQRYPLQAYGFVLATLNDAISRLEQPRHISGQELAEGFRYAAHHPIVRLLLVSALGAPLLIFPLQQLLPGVVKEG